MATIFIHKRTRRVQAKKQKNNNNNITEKSNMKLYGAALLLTPAIYYVNN